MRDIKTMLFKIVTRVCKKGCTYHFALSKITFGITLSELLIQNDSTSFKITVHGQSYSSLFSTMPFICEWFLYNLQVIFI